MHLLAWLAAFFACLWMADYFYGSSETVLGFVCIGVALFALVLLLFAIRDDLNIFLGHRNSDDL